MVGFNLLLEGVLSAWYFKEAFFAKTDGLYGIILVWVLYLSVKIVLYLRWGKRNHWVWFLLTAAAVAAAQGLVFGPMSLFFMLCVTQALMLSPDQMFYFSLAGFSLALAVPPEFTESFVAASAFVWIIQFSIKTLTAQAEKLSARADRFRIKTEQLQESADALKETDVSARYASQLEERSRIAQKLHDELGHTLSGSSMQLEAILLILEKDPKKAKRMLEQVIAGLREGTDAIRQILKDIKPEAASLNIGNIKLLASGAQERSGIKTEVAYDALIADISRRQWQAITENIREALTNMMKHSNATRAIIRFERLNKLFKVTVKDNGKGCAHVESGLGIAGMEERCAKLGGRLVVDGAQGFSVIMLLPVEGEKEEEDGYGD